jgi:hypothetical protein
MLNLDDYAIRDVTRLRADLISVTVCDMAGRLHRGTWSRNLPADEQDRLIRAAIRANPIRGLR